MLKLFSLGIIFFSCEIYLFYSFIDFCFLFMIIPTSDVHHIEYTHVIIWNDLGLCFREKHSKSVPLLT